MISSLGKWLHDRSSEMVAKRMIRLGKWRSQIIITAYTALGLFDLLHWLSCFEGSFFDLC
ncbi:MAG: hypothetical protein KME57_20355 [Scytonema hyalinum WJT4-NPBG1]|nr:hypothetical protein [Scytonema hyalinum WJT4-NPBG1]